MTRDQREDRTLEAVLTLSCRRRHRTPSLCPECAGLLSYSRQRWAGCPRKEARTTCAACPASCYRPDRRQEVRLAMRTGGPRMLFVHPWLTLTHAVAVLRR